MQPIYQIVANNVGNPMNSGTKIKLGILRVHIIIQIIAYTSAGNEVSEIFLFQHNEPRFFLLCNTVTWLKQAGNVK